MYLLPRSVTGNSSDRGVDLMTSLAVHLDSDKKHLAAG